MSKKKTKLESMLTTQQKKAALLIVENEINDRLENKKRTVEQIAKEIGISRKTLWEWRYKNEHFNEYVDVLTDDVFSRHKAGVFGQVLKAIYAQQPSMKAAGLYGDWMGLKTNKHQIETVDANSARTNEDLEDELKDLDKLLDE